MTYTVNRTASILKMMLNAFLCISCQIWKQRNICETEAVELDTDVLETGFPRPVDIFDDMLNDTQQV